MTNTRRGAGSESRFSGLRRIPVAQDWFSVYRVSDGLCVLHEARHYEETTVSLLLGEHRAALIDTGCGIGDLRGAVEELTDLPVVVVNTHVHADHIGGNSQFDEIALFDHPRSRRVAARGVPRRILQSEILAEKLISGPWPRAFRPEEFELPGFPVDRWLREGEPIDLGGSDLELIHTPGEAPDHICLLDRRGRILFCGDILLHGAVWTHLEGGSLEELIASYRKLLAHFDDFDHLMPSHNDCWLDKSLLPEALAGAEDVPAGRVQPEDFVDPWNRRLKRYPFHRFEILTR